MKTSSWVVFVRRHGWSAPDILASVAFVISAAETLWLQTVTLC